MSIEKANKPQISLYQKRSRLKWIVLGISVLISIGSVYYTNYLVEKIRKREQQLISLYANTLEYFANEQNSSNLNFIFEEIIVSNNTIPVIVTDELGNPSDYKNIPAAEKAKTEKARRRVLLEELEEMEEEHEPILITLKNDLDETSGYQFIYYKNSLLLTQLKFYPIAQLSVIAIFGMIAFLAFNYSRTAEQNRVWVGLAKETAHQLGTPLSSLMAWVEYFKTDPDLKDKEIVTELEKDIHRLEMITSRFSNIGSEPVLQRAKLMEVIEETVSYLRKRVSTKVSIEISAFPNEDISAEINKPLFEWVIENLCKNAVDAMAGVGQIKIRILQANEGTAVIDISDTGKGITKSRIGKIFQPGFTTKKRGWGLGLTLVKRIIENYHKGRIFVKSSDVNHGTTFRISLNSK